MKFYLISIFILFIIFGFDIRKNALAKPLVMMPLIVIMKCSCVFLFIIYISSIISVTQFDKIHYLTAVLTTFGTILVMWSKITLGKNFAWTGYYLTESEHITHGPYKYMRHPLYYGIYLVETGASIFYLSVIWGREHFLIMLVLGTIPLLYAFLFNLTMSRKEMLLFQNPKIKNVSNDGNF